MAHLFSQRQGISSHLGRIWAAWSFPRFAVLKFIFYINLYRFEAGVSGNLCSFPKEVNPLVLYDVEHGIAMEPKKGKWSSSRVDLGYTELFCIPEVIAVFLSFSDSGLGDSLVFHQAH